MRPLQYALLALAFLLFTSCAPKNAQFGPKGVSSEELGYRVAYVAGSQELLMPSEWRLDNFTESRWGGLEPKSGTDYVAEFVIDRDGDGTPDTTEKRSRYDLRFVHRTNAGVVFFRHIPIAPSLATVEPRVLLRDYVNAIAGASYDTVEIGGERQLLNKERRHAAKVISQGEGTWAGVKAYRAEIEIADLDQLKLDPSARESRVTLVLAHAPYRLKVKNARGRGTRDSLRVPVVVMAGYANRPDDFDTGVEAFANFLERVSFSETPGATAFHLASVEASPSEQRAARPEPAPARPEPDEHGEPPPKSSATPSP